MKLPIPRHLRSGENPDKPIPTLYLSLSHKSDSPSRLHTLRGVICARTKRDIRRRLLRSGHYALSHTMERRINRAIRLCWKQHEDCIEHEWRQLGCLAVTDDLPWRAARYRNAYHAFFAVQAHKLVEDVLRLAWTEAV